MYYVFHDLRFGIPRGDLREIVAEATNSGVIVATLTWGSILCELAVALLLCCRKTRPRTHAIYLATGLHIGIFLFIGLFSFAFIMIGSVAIASGATRLFNHPQRYKSAGVAEDEAYGLKQSASERGSG